MPERKKTQGQSEPAVKIEPSVTLSLATEKSGLKIQTAASPTAEVASIQVTHIKPAAEK